jgi:hypothetical protein
VYTTLEEIDEFTSVMKKLIERGRFRRSLSAGGFLLRDFDGGGAVLFPAGVAFFVGDIPGRFFVIDKPETAAIGEAEAFSMGCDTGFAFEFQAELMGGPVGGDGHFPEVDCQGTF